MLTKTTYPKTEQSVSSDTRVERIDRLTRLLDDAFQIPGTKYRAGWDSVVGLVPVLGDIATTALSGYIIYQAHKAGASRTVLARMIANVGFDFVAGSIPLVGDLFDVAFKSNLRNARLLKRHLGKRD
ncbi:MAG: DUF4112 domain-containing protein [Planctomycetaceae bacterium]|nr:DUF4112 domain-containing protein [Planctomycetaceae bacterium]